MAVPSLKVDLPWQSLAAGGNVLSGLGSDPAAAAQQLGQNYNSAYQGALGLNQALYSGTQSGYDTLRNNVSDQYADVVKGYSDLAGDVLGRIAGTNQTNLTDINTAYDANQGAALQRSVSGGLGNSSTQQGLSRAIELDRARAITGSQNQFAQLGAGYAASLGGARLGAQQQGIGLGANLGQAQLGALERVNAGYPDAGMYSNLAQMYGAQSQAAANKKAQQAALGAAGAGQMSSPGGASPASPFGSRPLNPNPFGGQGSSGSSGGSPGFNYATGGYGSGPTSGSQYYAPGEGFNGTPPLNYNSGYGSLFQDNLNTGMYGDLGGSYDGSDYGGGDFGGGYSGGNLDFWGDNSQGASDQQYLDEYGQPQNYFQPYEQQDQQPWDYSYDPAEFDPWE